MLPFSTWPFSKMTDNGRAILWLLRKDTMGWEEHNRTWVHKDTGIKVDLVGISFQYASIKTDANDDKYLVLSYKDKRKLWWGCHWQMIRKYRAIRRKELKDNVTGGMAQAAVFTWAIKNGHMKRAAEAAPSTILTRTVFSLHSGRRED